MKKFGKGDRKRLWKDLQNRLSELYEKITGKGTWKGYRKGTGKKINGVIAILAVLFVCLIVYGQLPNLRHSTTAASAESTEAQSEGGKERSTGEGGAGPDGESSEPSSEDIIRETMGKETKEADSTEGAETQSSPDKENKEETKTESKSDASNSKETKQESKSDTPNSKETKSESKGDTSNSKETKSESKGDTSNSKEAKSESKSSTSNDSKKDSSPKTNQDAGKKTSDSTKPGTNSGSSQGSSQGESKSTAKSDSQKSTGGSGSSSGSRSSQGGGSQGNTGSSSGQKSTGGSSQYSTSGSQPSGSSSGNSSANDGSQGSKTQTSGGGSAGTTAAKSHSSALEPGDMAGLKAGTMVSQEDISKNGAQSYFYIYYLDNEVFNRINGKSYSEDCTIPKDDLRYVKVLHYGADGKVYVGEMISHKDISICLAKIFWELYENKYPIEKMVLVDNYNADDLASAGANNSSCFNYRETSGTGTGLSKHAYGLAVDINPRYNPYVFYDESGQAHCQPENGAEYLDRNKQSPYKIVKDDLCYQLFISHGFSWGGEWGNEKDYMHFYIP